jgi:hypothetical protein
MPDGLEHTKMLRVWECRLPPTIRIASHLTIWVVVIVPAAVLAAHGWRPTEDDALIALRSWWVFSDRTPLVGTASTAVSSSHQAFGLGPLQFWLLAIPARLNRYQGILWGAYFWCGLVLSLAIEAAWKTRGWVGSAAVAFVTIDLAWQTPVFGNLVWNPNFGLVFLVAAVAFSWAVAEGSLQLWPVLVVCGSIAAQCHLFYLFPVMALVVGAPLIAIAVERPSRCRWLGVGLAVGALCWVVPFGQELFGHPGNISVLLAGTNAQVGSGFGLRTLSMAGSIHPIWLTPFPSFIAIANETANYIGGFSAVWGGVVLVLVSAVAVIAWWKGHRPLAIVATIGAVLAITTVVTFSSFPAGTELGATVYLIPSLWLVGMILWIVFVWAAVEVSVAAWRPRRTLTFVIVLIFLGIVTEKATRTVYRGAISQAALVSVGAPLDNTIAEVIERNVPRKPTVIVLVQPAVIRLSHGPIRDYEPDYWSIGWQLVVDGWRPALPEGTWAQGSGLTLPRNARWTTATVQLRYDRLVVADIRVGHSHL